jgi:hypothetical protein
MIAEPNPDGAAPAPTPPPAPTADQMMREFQMELLSATLAQFIENIEGATPPDRDLEAESMHCCFSATPLTRFRHAEFTFTDYFVWRGTHALAHGFLVPGNPTALVVCRLTRDQWPPALSAYVSQHYGADHQ